MNLNKMQRSCWRSKPIGLRAVLSRWWRCWGTRSTRSPIKKLKLEWERMVL